MKRNLFLIMRALFLMVPLSILIHTRAQAQLVIDGNIPPQINTGNSLLQSSILISGGYLENAINDPDQSYIIEGDFTVQSGTFLNTGGKIYIMGNLTLEAGVTFKNDGDIYVMGNIINNLPMTSGTEGIGTLHLTGNAAQTVSGTTPFITNNLEIDNVAGLGAAGDIQLQQSIKVDNAATFTQGIVTTPGDAAPLIFGANAAEPITPGNASHVNGIVRSLENNGSFVYPVGDGSLYHKIQANITANASGLDGKYIPGDAGAAPFTTGGTAGTELLQAYYSGEYWQMKPVTTTSASLTIYYGGNPNPPVIGDISDLRVAHRVDNPSAQWWNEGNVADAGSTTIEGSVTSNPLTTPAQWTDWGNVTLGSINKKRSPLPVTIISFTPAKEGSNAVLNWKVAQEENLTGYAIERSCDGINYQRIGFVTANGGPSYNYKDMNVPCNKVTYRLRVDDIDGKYDYSKTVSLSFGQDADQPITVAPNPVTDHYSINIPAGNPGNYSFMLYSRSGQRISQSAQIIGTAATTVTLQRANGIARGMYVLVVYNENTGAKKVVQLIFN